MTPDEIEALEMLMDIANENDLPLTDWESQFVHSLHSRRHDKMAEKQADVFDRLVDKHVRVR